MDRTLVLIGRAHQGDKAARDLLFEENTLKTWHRSSCDNSRNSLHSSSESKEYSVAFVADSSKPI